jgi:hypothetical protein
MPTQTACYTVLFISESHNKTHITYIAQHVDWRQVTDLPVFREHHMKLQKQIIFGGGVCGHSLSRLPTGFWFK